MARGGRRRPLVELNDRALIARNCGRRFYEAGYLWATEFADGGPELDWLLTDDEREARQHSLPASWERNWWAGFNDAAAADAAGEG